MEIDFESTCVRPELTAGGWLTAPPPASPPSSAHHPAVSDPCREPARQTPYAHAFEPAGRLSEGQSECSPVATSAPREWKRERAWTCSRPSPEAVLCRPHTNPLKKTVARLPCVRLRVRLIHYVTPRTEHGPREAGRLSRMLGKRRRSEWDLCMYAVRKRWWRHPRDKARRVTIRVEATGDGVGTSVWREVTGCCRNKGRYRKAWPGCAAASVSVTVGETADRQVSGMS
jgi:hypothetical protein